MSKKSKKPTKRAKPEGNWIDRATKAMQEPVPAEVFAFSIELYQNAAQLRIPGSNIPRPDPDKPGYYLTDIPMNRGMLAVARESKHLTEEQRQSLLMRIMHFGEVMELAQKDQRFAKHVMPKDDGTVLISAPFQDSYAACRFRVTDKHIGPDMDHLWQLVQEHPESE